MSFDKLILRQVDKAFKIADSLATTVTLVRKHSSGFNFSTNTPNLVIDSSLTIKGLQKKRYKSPTSAKDSNNSQHIDMVFKTSDIGDPSLYDEAIIDGVTWKITPPYDATTFITTVALVREI